MNEQESRKMIEVVFDGSDWEKHPEAYKDIVKGELQRSYMKELGWVEEKELNSALAQLAEKDKEIAMLRDVLTLAKDELNDLWSYCGKGLEVHGWHLNGNPEPLDNFFEDNSCGAREAIEEALSATSAPTYIHTDKVKPLVEGSERVMEWLDGYRLSKGLGEGFPPLKCLKDAIAHYKQLTGEE